MSTAVVTSDLEEAEGDPVTRILIPLPKRCLDWLEREALRRKQEAGAGRMAKAPIIVELIERAMRENGGGQE